MKTKLIGRLAVDSGQILLCDPAYIANKFSEDDFSPDKPDTSGLYPLTYNGACGATMSNAQYGQLGENGVPLAVAVASGLGDGTYPVHAEIVNDPVWGERIASIFIDFLLVDNENLEDE